MSGYEIIVQMSNEKKKLKRKKRAATIKGIPRKKYFKDYHKRWQESRRAVEQENLKLMSVDDLLRKVGYEFDKDETGGTK